MDPAHFTRPLGETVKSSATFKDLSSLPPAPQGGTSWSWMQPSWRLQTTVHKTDPEGWVYAMSSGSFLKRGQTSTYSKPGSVTYFRRRVWARKRVRYLMAGGSPVGSPLSIGRRASNLLSAEGVGGGKAVGSPVGVSAAGGEDRAQELQLPDTPGSFRSGLGQESGRCVISVCFGGKGHVGDLFLQRGACTGEGDTPQRC